MSRLKTILVDDEPLTMEMFRLECENDRHIEIVGCFSDPREALAYAKRERVEFALLDIDMPYIIGTELARLLRELNNEVIIIFVTAYSSYAVDAIRLKMDYFVLKPYSLDDVKDVLQRAVLLSARTKKRAEIRTFGHFDLFVDGKPVKFISSKAKELLALMVDRRGGEITPGEMLAALYEDIPSSDITQSYCRKALMNLRRTLEAVKCSDILSEEHNGRSVNVTAFECDYYDYLDGKSDSPIFPGEYMSQYSWAEMTLAALERIAESRK